MKRKRAPASAPAPGDAPDVYAFTVTDGMLTVWPEGYPQRAVSVALKTIYRLWKVKRT